MSNFLKKYQPKSVSDMVISDLRQMMIFDLISRGQATPNLLFYGDNGSGKTSLARALIADYYTAYDDNDDDYDYINLGSSSDINRLKNTVQLVMLNNSGHRWFILDESEKVANKRIFDELHDVIENSFNASFIMTTNNMGILPGGLRSRCRPISISVPTPDQFLLRAFDIVSAEGINATPDEVLNVLRQGDPDIRGYMFGLEMFCISRRNAGLTVPLGGISPPTATAH